MTCDFELVRESRWEIVLLWTFQKGRAVCFATCDICYVVFGNSKRRLWGRDGIKPSAPRLLEYEHRAIFQPPCASISGVFDRTHKSSESEELIPDRCSNFGVFEKAEHSPLLNIDAWNGSFR
jgi:hypothetical protein